MHARLSWDQVNVVADRVGELWHKRLCHMSQKGMQMFPNKELLPEMKKVHMEKCSVCVAGKQNRAVFRPRLPMRRKNGLELVHTYVCQVDAKSHAGGQYFVTFIDDYS